MSSLPEDTRQSDRRESAMSSATESSTSTVAESSLENRASKADSWHEHDKAEADCHVPELGFKARGPLSQPDTLNTPLGRSASRVSQNTLLRTVSRASERLRVVTSALPPAFQAAVDEQYIEPEGKLDEKGHVHGEDGKEEDPIEYPDGGWRAWSVVAGGWMTAFCAFGMTGAFGAFQTYYYNDLLKGYSASTISWIGSAASFIAFFLSTFSGPLFDKYGARMLMLTGSTIMILGYLLLSFCKQYWQIFLCQTIVVSIGFSTVLVCPIGVTNQWFAKRKGLAVGALLTGSSVGAIVWPLILAYLPQKIGFAWTIRVITLLMAVFLYGGTLLLRTRLPPKPAGPLFHLAAFWENKAYLCVALSGWLFSYAFFFVLFYIGQYAIQLGLGARGNFLLILVNAGSIFGRVGSGFLADRMGRFNIAILGIVISVIAVFCLQACKTFPSLIILSLVYGVATGGNISLQPVCVAQITEDQRLIGTMTGQLFGFSAIALLIGPPISGAILGTDPSKLLSRFAYATVLNGVMLALSAVSLIVGRCLQDKRLFVKV